MALTARQLRVLRFIAGQIAETGNTPKFRDIMAATGGKSLGSIADTVDLLESCGYIRTLRGPKGRLVSIEVISVPEPARRPYLPLGQEVGVMTHWDYGHCRDYLTGHSDDIGIWRASIRVHKNGQIDPPCLLFSPSGRGAAALTPAGSRHVPDALKEKLEDLNRNLQEQIR
jgi:hypothetical protein